MKIKKVLNTLLLISFCSLCMAALLAAIFAGAILAAFYYTLFG